MQKRAFAHARCTDILEYNTRGTPIQGDELYLGYTFKNLSNHFSMLLQDNSLFLSVHFVNLLSELNEITSALLIVNYREGRLRKTL